MATPASWFTPRRLLFLFCCINLLVYADRGVISSNGVNGSSETAGHAGSGIEGDFVLSLFEDGVLPAAFMVGLLITSPIFAEASKYNNAFRLISLGLSIWTVAVAGCGLAWNFWSLVVCRMFVGVGEASFVALASPFIDDNAPAERKTLWLATFYLCMPVGYAVGYIFGGVVGVGLGWRAAFLLEALAMIPLVLFCLLVPPIDLKGTHEIAAKEEAQGEAQGLKRKVACLCKDLETLATNRVYVYTIAGTTVFTGVLGAYAYLGPKAGREIFVLPAATADITFGGVTVITGTVGTIAGGMLLDYIGSTIRNALLVCVGCMVLGSSLVALSFGVARQLWEFIPLFGAGQFVWFAMQAPSNAVILWSVPSGMRPFAMSVSIVVSHLLGDVPSPPLLGLFQSVVKNWRISMGCFTMLLYFSAIAYALGAVAAPKQADYRFVDENNGIIDTVAVEDAEGALLADASDTR